MARYLGSKSVLYLSASGASAAISVPNLTKFNLSNARKLVDVTACADTNMTYLPGLPDFKGSFEVFFDDTNTAALFTASSSSTANKFYLYPSSDAATLYFYGTAWPSLSNFDSGGVGGGIKLSFEFAAASTITAKMS